MNPIEWTYRNGYYTHQDVPNVVVVQNTDHRYVMTWLVDGVLDIRTFETFHQIEDVIAPRERPQHEWSVHDCNIHRSLLGTVRAGSEEEALSKGRLLQRKRGWTYEDITVHEHVPGAPPETTMFR